MNPAESGDATVPQKAGRTMWSRRLARFRLWGRRTGFGLKLEIGLALLALISGAATYVALSRRSAAIDVTDGTIALLLLVNLVLLVSLAALVARRVVTVWFEKRRGSAGSRLHLRFVGLFALVAAVPPVIMAIFSALFLQFGVQNWFSESVRGALNNSLEVASAYIEEHRQNIRLDLLAMSNDLNRLAGDAERDRSLLKALVEEQALIRSLQEAVVFDSTGRVMAKYSFGLDLSANRVPDEVMQRVQGGETVVISDPGDDQIRALTRLDNYLDAFLYVGRRVDPRVTAHVEAARMAVANYRELEGQRSLIQLRSNGIFIVISLLILLAAVWIGLRFAGRLVTPIGRLVEAAEKIRQGDLSVRAEGPDGPDEIGVLSRTFNRMTRRLEAQQKELVSTNRELDERRRFLEAVLEGVSAGILRVSPAGRVLLSNRSACDLLGADAGILVDASLADIAPAMGPLLEEASLSEQKIARAQINLTRGEQVRSLLVRVAAEVGETGIAGHVVTFDDVTEQLRDQRTAAWADVARRIAHEIKNPLTPIQLSAERLRRKYADEIVSDPAIFTRCTDTIIRQVGDLRRMVDEFSSFARMPAPVFCRESLGEIIHQTVFLQDMGGEDIVYQVDLPEDGVEMVCDGRLLSQALTNVLKNAGESIAARREESGEPCGRVVVRLCRRDDRVDIIVEDDGRGLPENAEHLVEPYVTTRSKGTGLGLAIVKKVVEEHAGWLALGNCEGGGARILLSFSIARLDLKLAQTARNRDEGTRAAE